MVFKHISRILSLGEIAWEKLAPRPPIIVEIAYFRLREFSDRSEREGEEFLDYDCDQGGDETRIRHYGPGVRKTSGLGWRHTVPLHSTRQRQ